MPAHTNDIRIQDNLFNAEKIGDYYLNLCHSGNTLTHAVYEPISNKYLSLEHHIVKTSITDLLEGHSYLSGRFWKKINLSFVSSSFSLIPSTLFDVGQVNNYVQLNHGVSKDENCTYDIHKSLGITNCYAYSNNVINEFKQFYAKEINISHHTTAFLKSISPQSNQPEAHILFLHKSITLALYSQDKLTYLNVFEARTPEDSLFYTLMAFKKLKLPQNTPTYLYGDISVFSSEYNRFKDFLSVINFAPRTTKYKFSLAFSELDDHSFAHIYQIQNSTRNE